MKKNDTCLKLIKECAVCGEEDVVNVPLSFLQRMLEMFGGFGNTRGLRVLGFCEECGISSCIADSEDFHVAEKVLVYPKDIAEYQMKILGIDSRGDFCTPEREFFQMIP